MRSLMWAIIGFESGCAAMGILLLSLLMLNSGVQAKWHDYFHFVEYRKYREHENESRG